MRILKTILFHFLMPLRRLMLFICKLLAGLFIFSGLMMLVFLGKQMNIMAVIFTLVLGIGFSALSWYYDKLLLWLQPEGTDLILYR